MPNPKPNPNLDFDIQVDPTLEPDEELLSLVSRVRAWDIDLATHRRCFDYAMAMVAVGDDPLRVPGVPTARQ